MRTIRKAGLSSTDVRVLDLSLAPRYHYVATLAMELWKSLRIETQSDVVSRIRVVCRNSSWRSIIHQTNNTSLIATSETNSLIQNIVDRVDERENTRQTSCSMGHQKKKNCRPKRTSRFWVSCGSKLDRVIHNSSLQWTCFGGRGALLIMVLERWRIVTVYWSTDETYNF